MAPGDIFLFHHPRGKSKLIAWLTKSPFYHVAIGVNPNEVIEAMPSGVVRTNLDKRPKDEFVVIPAPKGGGQAALEWAQSKIGDGYDARDLIGLGLDRVFTHLHINYVRGDRFTCGEFVATAFQNAGARLFPDIGPEDVLPADFARLLPENVAADLKAG